MKPGLADGWTSSGPDGPHLDRSYPSSLQDLMKSAMSSPSKACSFMNVHWASLVVFPILWLYACDTFCTSMQQPVSFPLAHVGSCAGHRPQAASPPCFASHCVFWCNYGPSGSLGFMEEACSLFKECYVFLCAGRCIVSWPLEEQEPRGASPADHCSAVSH